MHIIHFEPPFHSLRCRAAMAGGRNSVEHIQFCKALTSGLPDDLDGIICTSDLQGVPSVEDETIAHKMLGEVVGEELAILGELGQIPQPKRLGVILAGDLYAFPEAAERGGKGDVLPVWRAFQERFRWVAGVAGNHDQYGEKNCDLVNFATGSGVFYLDGGEVQIDGMSIAGLGGIIGRPSKPFRRTEADYVSILERLAFAKPDVLVLHEAPEGPEPGQVGSASVRAALEKGPAGLVVCGHKEWPNPLCDLANGTQVLNVEFRVVLLLPSSD